MSMKGMLFSAPMVRALLAGTKTQTRRLVKPDITVFVQSTPDAHPPKHPAPYLDAYCGEKKTDANPRGMSRDWCWWTRDNRPGPFVAKAFCVPGDEIWVREAWKTCAPYDPFSPAQIDGAAAVLWLADGAKRLNGPEEWGRYRNGRFMPRWASRITLRVTAVRVQRLQDISEEDAIAEGVESLRPGFWKAYDCKDGFCTTALRSYEMLWNEINGPGSWDANPYVWAYTFTVLKGRS